MGVYRINPSHRIIAPPIGLGAPGLSWVLLGALGLSWAFLGFLSGAIFAQRFFPDSSGEEAFPKEVWMLIFAHFFIDSSGEEALPKELGCAKRGRFLHNFFQILVVRAPFQRKFG